MLSNYEIAHKIFDDAYQGTAMNIGQAVDWYEEKHGTVDMEVHDIIDNLGFECVICSNVCEISELSSKDFDEMLCTDCEDEV